MSAILSELEHERRLDVASGSEVLQGRVAFCIERIGIGSCFEQVAADVEVVGIDALPDRGEACAGFL